MSITPESISNTSLTNIRQHNALTEARHDLSAVQLDIYFMLLSLLRQSDKNTKYEITMKQIQTLTGREWQYKQLKDATLGLIGKVFEINESDGLLQVSMLSSAKYVNGTGTIQLSISDEVKPYLLDLKNNFSNFELYSALSITNKYGKWIYVMCSRWKDLGIKKITIDELRRRLNITDLYKQWGQLKERVLDPSMAQINQTSDLIISYAVSKRRGKKIVELVFTIEIKKAFQTLIPFEDNNSSQAEVDATKLKTRLNKMGVFDPNIIHKIISDDGMRMRAFNLLYDMQFKKEIKNNAGYFLVAMGLKE